MKLKNLEKAAIIITLLLFFAATGLSINAQSKQRSEHIEIRTMAPEISSPTPIDEGLVNINTASADELCSLKGIGPAIAQRIIDYRTQHGDFTAITDIIDVSGIGISTFENIKDNITV